MMTSHLMESSRLARDLHVLLANQVPVPEALAQVRARASGRWAVGLRKAQEAAESGSSLAQALRQAQHFPRLLVEGLEASEEPAALDRLSHLLEEAEWRQRQVTLVLSYPFILSCPFILLAAGFFLIYLAYGEIGHQIIALFDEISLQLPLTTQMVVWVIKFVSHPLFVAGGLALLGALQWVLSGGTHVFFVPIQWLTGSQAAATEYRLRLPLVGTWIGRSESVTWLSWVDFFFGCGMPVPEAMRRAAMACGDPAFRRKAEAAAAAADRGQDLSKALTREGFLPQLAVYLLERGQALGFPNGYLGQVADVLRRELEVEQEGGLAVLEVLALVCVGAVLPPVVLFLFLPLYQLFGNIYG